MTAASSTCRSWQVVRVGDICRAVNGRAFKPTEWVSEGLPIIRIQNLKNEGASFNYYAGDVEAKFRVKHGDLLFAWSGTPGTSFGAHIWHGRDAVLNQHIFNLHFDREVADQRFLCYALNRNVADYVAKAQGGVGLAHITKGKFDDSTVPLPDITEQRRIVAEIEKQFSRLDEAVANLQRVKANLKRFEKATVEQMTEAASFKPAFTGTIGGVAVSLDNLRRPVNKTERATRPGGVPYLGANGRTGWIDVPLFDEELVLVVEDETFVGRTAPFSYYFAGKCWVNNHTHVLRAKPDVALPKYLNLALSYYPFIPLTTGSTGRRKLTKAALMAAPISLPTLVQQREIVAEVDLRLSIVREVEAEVDANLKRALALRQAILGQAFGVRAPSVAEAA